LMDQTPPSTLAFPYLYRMRYYVYQAILNGSAT
jgi:hypothetical protein